MRFFIKHFSIRFIPLHILKECYMIFNFTLCIGDMVWLFNLRKLFALPIIILKPNFVLLRWVYVMVIIRLGLWLNSLFILFLCLYLHLQWVILSRVLIFILPLWLAPSFSCRAATSRRAIRHSITTSVLSLSCIYILLILITSININLLIVYCNT